MGQMGFFDLVNRYTGLDAKNEPLLKIDGVVPWEDLRARLEAVWRRADKVRKSRAGRKPWDAIVMFKTIILCALYNLSDDQVEHQIRDRLSCMRFLGLGLGACPRFDVVGKHWGDGEWSCRDFGCLAHGWLPSGAWRGERHDWSRRLMALGRRRAWPGCGRCRSSPIRM